MKVISLILCCCCIIVGCKSKAQVKCEELMTESFAIPTSIEEMLDTTRGIYRLKECGLDRVDIELLTPSVAVMVMERASERKEFNYNDVLNLFGEIKRQENYSELRKEVEKRIQQQKDAPIAPKEQPDYSMLCDTPKYAGLFPLLEGYQQYFDYRQALKCAKEQDKILMVYFTGHSAVICRKLEKVILQNQQVKDLINTNCVVVALYCDENALGVSGESVGAENLSLEQSKFDGEEQPLVVFVNKDEKELARTGYGSIEGFLKSLNTAIIQNKTEQ